jgi:hypothetical protein
MKVAENKQSKCSDIATLLGLRGYSRVLPRPFSCLIFDAKGMDACQNGLGHSLYCSVDCFSDGIGELWFTRGSEQ